MGVKGLWKLLLPIGRRISVETLEGRVVAVDASIWLTQFVKAMRDPDTGRVHAGAHLIGFFRRLCKLRYHGIRPVFVFDGAAPEIKRREVMRRRRRREQFAALGDADIQRLARKLLAENLKKAAAKQKSKPSGRAPGADPDVTSAAGAAAVASSFEVGFNPGGENEVDDAAVVDEKQPWATKDESDTTSNPNHESGSYAVDAANASSDEENDWGEGGQKMAGTTRPGAEGEDGGSDRSSDEDEDDDDVFDSAAQLYDDGEFDVDLMANLPASKRKDAVERAQRRRRMESRKEFMPAAADPMRFSNVQLSNFLKTCKLNRDISSAAQKAAQKDNLHDAMASNRGTLVELIRENDDVASDEGSEHEGDDEGSGSVMPNKISHGGGLDQCPSRLPAQPKKKQRLKRQAEEPGDSSENDFFSNDSRLKGTDLLTRGRVMLDDDVESEDGSPGGFIPVPTLRGAADTAETHRPEDRTNASSSAKTAQQEQLDFELALALQEAETSGGCAARGLPTAHQFTHPDPIDLANTDDASAHSEKVPQRSSTEREASDSVKSHPSTVAESSSSIGMENLNFRGTHISTASARINDLEDASNRTLKSGESADVSGVDDDVIVREAAKPSGSDNDDDDDVGWEDGAGENSALGRNESPNVSPAHSTPDDEWSAAPQTSTTDATAAALERGLSTASRLTNWAGVAFRRAMQASGQAASNAPSDVEKQMNGPLGDARAHQGVEKSLKRGADAELLQLQMNPNQQVDRSDTQPVDVRASVSGDASASQTIHFDDDDVQRWAADRNSRERDLETITDDMREEVIQLLQLFGVPFIEAPAEAEAQCVALEKLGLVHGIVTEDSDVFVFGGKTVYKNIFEEQKYAEVYKADDAAREMQLGQEEIVALALLLGGDYTEGVRGVGIVNAMEILETFPMAMGTKVGLTKFKEWLDGISMGESLADVDDGTSRLMRFHEKHRTARTRWTTPEGFPADNVIQAYVNPVVDKSNERFTWARPDVEKLITFFQQYVGWSSNETKKYLDPVIAKLESGLRQTRLDSYMKYEDSIQFADVRSKRLRRVLGLSPTDANLDSSQPSKSRGAWGSMNPNGCDLKRA